VDKRFTRGASLVVQVPNLLISSRRRGL